MIQIQNTKHNNSQSEVLCFEHLNHGASNLFEICNLRFVICNLFGISLTKKSLTC